jgi:Uncharacterised nucleotidyltransferase
MPVWTSPGEVSDGAYATRMVTREPATGDGAPLAPEPVEAAPARQTPAMGVCLEAELVLAGVRTNPDAAHAERLARLLRYDLDWVVLICLAQHGVLPLLYRRLQTASPDLLPTPVRSQLQIHFHANAQRNLFLAGTLLQLLRLFEAHGIAALPYKGPILAVSAYGNLALRQFADLDLLVRPQDTPRARELLLARGYQLLSHARIACFERSRKVDELLSADGQVLVELHRAPTSWTFYFPFPAARLWEQLETVSLCDMPVWTLAPEALLLVLCVHGAKHHWGRLGWICDVAALLGRHPGLDWDRVLAQAGHLGGRRMLCPGLLLAHDLVGADLPEILWRPIEADPVLPWLAGQVQARLFNAADHLPEAMERPLFYLRLRERFRDRARCSGYVGYRLLTARFIQLGRPEAPSTC